MNIEGRLVTCFVKSGHDLACDGSMVVIEYSMNADDKNDNMSKFEGKTLKASGFP
jgi:hypothetical protein